MQNNQAMIQEGFAVISKAGDPNPLVDWVTLVVEREDMKYGCCEVKTPSFMRLVGRQLDMVHHLQKLRQAKVDQCIEATRVGDEADANPAAAQGAEVVDDDEEGAAKRPKEDVMNRIPGHVGRNLGTKHAHDEFRCPAKVGW